MTILIILLAILGLLWLALLQPVWIKVTSSPDSVEFEICYLWFRVRPLEAESKPTPEQEEEESDDKKRRFSPRRWLELLPDIWSALRKSMQYLFRRIMVREAHASGSFGLNDPAETGMTFGACQAILSLAPRVVKERIEIAPDFEETGVRITGAFKGGIRPSSVLNSGLVLLWHLPKWKMIQAIRNS